MIVLFDADFITILFDSKARVPRDPDTKKPIDRGQDRIDFLVQTLSKNGKIILPAPALAEFMIIADNWDQYLTIIRKKAVFEIAGFDLQEATELVAHWKKSGRGKLRRSGVDTWAKLKYDRQIAAIAQTRRVKAIYSTDNDLHKLAAEMKIDCYGLTDLPLPPPQQLTLVETEKQNGLKKEKEKDQSVATEIRRGSGGSTKDKATGATQKAPKEKRKADQE